ncbi:MAG TPA: hypothetical protein VH573_04985 [Mycobacteriales bacterium]
MHDLPSAAAHLTAERGLPLELLAHWDVRLLSAAPADDLLRETREVVTKILRADTR